MSSQRYRSITDETRQRAVKQVTELLPHTTSVAQAVRVVAERFSVSPNSIRNWMANAGIDPTQTLAEQRLAQAQAQIARLTELNEALAAGRPPTAGSE
ncbi:transposase [Williamsia limnetica]|uniref:Transposase n=1 Tax=Williamsia limnetica TaxID=882452 RepID=A0A318RBQ7_WILLI|nr:transposase [Williamsia limnetica]PYE12031.1 transposase [Williamsia limnetica]